MALGPAGEILRLAGDRAAHLHDEVRAALREGMAEFSATDGVGARRLDLDRLGSGPGLTSGPQARKGYPPVENELLEREDELGSLTAALGSVRDSGRGRLIALSGEAGIGKTHPRRGVLCPGREGAPASSPARARPSVRRGPWGLLSDIARQTGGELGAAIEDGARASAVIDALLADLDGPTPAVAVLEDLHWADEATLDVLRLLGPADRERALPGDRHLSRRPPERASPSPGARGPATSGGPADRAAAPHSRRRRGDGRIARGRRC